MSAAIPTIEATPHLIQSAALTNVRHIILDRDGVLNEERVDTSPVSRPSGFRWLPGSLEALSDLRAMGLRVSVATNQSGIGRGALSELELSAIHEKMSLEAKDAGGSIDAIFYCPHRPEECCTCRKPAPGLILAAIKQSGIAGTDTLVIGDATRDLQAARSAGTRAVLVRTGKGRLCEDEAVAHGFPVFDDLKAVTSLLFRGADESSVQGFLQGIFAEHIAVVAEAARQVLPSLAECIHVARQCLNAGNKILVCGNGGSAADAQHFVAELVGRYSNNRAALSAVALGTDAATVTALSNDFGFDQVFARQVEALARPGDLLIALSTSGNSPNIINAAIAAGARDCVVIALTGRTGGKLIQYADIGLRVSTDSVARIQEVHELCLHSLAQVLDSAAPASIAR